MASIRTTLLTELLSSGVHAASGEQAMVTVSVTLSENVREYVWVGEIHHGKNERVVAMVAVPRTELASVQQSATGVVLRKQLLWSQEDAILDVALLDSSHMAVLDGGKVTLFHMEKGHWQRDQELPVQHAQAWPRDLRGRLVAGKDHLLDAYLPGTFCRTAQHGALVLECTANDLWPMGGEESALKTAWHVGGTESGLAAAMDAKKNFFTGTFTQLTTNAPHAERIATVPPFYSAVALPREKYVLWIFTAVDGSIHALDGMTDQIWSELPWGSDVAAVHTGCGSGWQVAASGKSDAGSDELRMYGVPDHEPITMSDSLSFPGRITALWAGSEAQAVVVIHNEETSQYEAYRVLFTCGD